MDKPTFEARTRALWPAMVRTARCIVRQQSDAEDAAAQAVLNCWKALPRLRDENAFEAWAMRSCINEAKMILRRQRRVEPRDEIPSPAIPGPGETLSLRDMLMCLPERDRLPLALMYESGLSLEQIAKALGVPRGTAASRLSRARTKLKTILEKEGYLNE